MFRRSSPSARRWRRGVTALVAVATAATGVTAGATLVAAPPAAADPAGSLEEALESFADCPLLPPDVQGLLCLHATVYDGNIKLGGVEAQVSDPITITAAVGLTADLGAVVALPDAPALPPKSPLEALLASVLARTQACGRGIPISGGILGQPALDPLLALDPLSLLCVSAEPTIGAPQIGDTAEALGLVNFLLGGGGTVVLGVPLTIKLNNLLFGEKCQIGTDANPISIRLTNGYTSPPPGIAPIQGSSGTVFAPAYTDPELGDVGYVATTGNRLVDNSFGVPGAAKCDILLGDLLDQPRGLLDGLINDMVGIPSPAGANLAAFSVDTEVINYAPVHRSILSASPATVAAGTVAVGTATAPIPVTITNTGDAPAFVGGEGPASGAAQASWLIGGCVGTVLAPGESCDLTATFAPSQAGTINGSLSVGGVNNLSVPLQGAGQVGTTAPMTAPAVAFGTVYFGQPATPKTATFTNNTGAPVTVGRPAAIRGSSTNAPMWSVTADACNGTTVAPGGTCTVDVVVAPTTTGSKNVSVDLRAADGAFLGTAALTASGANAMTAPTTAFGSVVVGNTAAPKVVTFTNVSPNPVSVTRAEPTVSGALADPRVLNSWDVVADGCSGQTVAPAATCTVEMGFAPDSTGSKSTPLTLFNGDVAIGSGSLTGTGGNPLTAPAAAFGTVPVGSSNGPLPLTFTNVSPNPMTITDYAMFGTEARFPSWQLVTDGCVGQTVAPGGTCTMDFTFAPTAPTGTKAITIQVFSFNTEVGSGSLTGTAS